MRFASSSTRWTTTLLLTTALACGAPPTGELARVVPSDAGFAPERLEQLDAVLEDYVTSGSLPGAVVMVLRDGAVAYEKAVGYSDAVAGTPLARPTPSSASLRRPRRS